MIDYRDDTKWTVYIHIVPKEINNHENDKYYVGITSQLPKRRWNGGYGYIKNIFFSRAIKKYGWNNIQHEVIAEHLTLEEACNMEKLLIKALNSNNYLYGYNQTEGGDTNSHRSYEGFNNPQAKPIYQFDLDYNFIKKYPSSIEADKLTGARSSEAARENYISANSYWAREDNIITENGNIYLKNIPQIKLRNEIFQFDKKLNFVKRYLSSREVERLTGIAKTSINRAAKQKIVCHEYYWLYKKDINLLGSDITIKENIKDIIINLSIDRYEEDGCIKIVNITNNELFSSITKASNYYKIDSSYLSKVASASVTNPRRTAKKCKWLLYKDYLKINNLTDSEARKSLFFIS